MSETHTRSKWPVVVILGVSALLIPVIGFVAGGIVGFLAPFPAGLITWDISFWLGVTTLFGACWFATRAASQRIGSTRPRFFRGALTGLAFVAPFAVAVGLRLSVKTCTGFNLLSLPWAAAVEIMIGWTCLAVIATSTAALIVGFCRPRLRGAALVITIYSLVAAVPVFMFYFLSIYGDPGPNCVPV